jgi:hypothetical protein
MCGLLAIQIDTDVCNKWKLEPMYMKILGGKKGMWGTSNFRPSLYLELRQKKNTVNSVKTLPWISPALLRGCIQTFPDWVDNEINKNKHLLKNNTKGYGGKTH